MEKHAEKFLEAEEAALKLIETLKQLQNEIKSYKTLREDLENIEQHLFKMLELIEEVSTNSLEALKIIMEIGGPQIVRRISEFENHTMMAFEKQNKLIENLIDKVKELNEKNLELFKDHTKALIEKQYIIFENFREDIKKVLLNVNEKFNQKFSETLELHFVKQKEDNENLKNKILSDLDNFKTLNESRFQKLDKNVKDNFTKVTSKLNFILIIIFLSFLLSLLLTYFK